MEDNQLLRPSQVAERLGLSRSTIYRWFWEGILQGVKLSDGSIRILESSVKKQTDILLP